MTGVVNFAEYGDSVDGGAVPTAIAELLLALAYRDHCARFDGVHHFHVASTDVLLAACKSDQIVALVLAADVRQSTCRRHRSVEHNRIHFRSSGHCGLF